MEEIWKPAHEYENLYEVSNFGDIRAVPKNGKDYRLLTPKYKDGYRRVRLSKNGVNKWKFIHRLVGFAFIPNPENKPYINHLNTIIDDNRVENLEWNTHKENCEYVFTVGDRRHLIPAIRSGREFHNEKKVLQLSLDGEEIGIHNTITNAAAYAGVGISRVWRALQKESRTSGGYRWKYL